MFDKSAKLLALFIGVFHILYVSGALALSSMNLRAIHLMIMLTIAFLSHKRDENFLKGPDLVLRLSGVIVSFITGFYILFRMDEFIRTGGLTNSTDAIFGAIAVALILIATKKFTGNSFAIIIVIFLLYPFIASSLPGILQARSHSFVRVFSFIYLTPQGIYGIPISVSASYIIIFCIFGAFLSEFGAGRFMFNLASSLTSNLVASTAKTAIVFSALIGTISGSAAGNVAVTGSLTIPMMKEKGYRPHIAAAVEAVASTGGQIMPPIMGAAAFIMAELTTTPYNNIMKAAIVPALLYFLAIYFIVHLIALKGNIDFTESKSEELSTIEVLKDGWYFVIPLVVLIYMLIIGYSPFKAAYFAGISLLIVSLLAFRDFSMTFFERIIKSIQKGVKDAVPVAIACAASGILIGIISLSGIGSKLSGLIMILSGDRLIVALVLTMFTSVILGMGLPTTAAYLVPVVVVGPALVQMGLPILTAHMFIFFFGCISTITPPVALSSYVAAGIAGAEVNKVGWTAFKFGIVSFILPYMFVYSPGLMLNGTLSEILFTIGSSIIGVYVIAISIVGYYKINLSLMLRAMLFIPGILLIKHGIITDLIAVVLVVSSFFMIQAQKKKIISDTHQ